MKTLIMMTGPHGKTDSGRPTYILNKEYAEAIRAAGGLPVLAVDAVRASDYASVAQGLVLTGGKDVSPALYGQSTIHPATRTDPLRDEMELALLRAFIEAGKPVLGICRGFQLINVHYGGSLFQHLPDLTEQNHEGGAMHKIEIVTDSALGSMFGSQAYVNSYHHQGVKTLGNQLRATAFTNLKNDHLLIEALEHEIHNVLAVQWHPERMAGINAKKELADMLPLFSWFVKSCS